MNWQPDHTHGEHKETERFWSDLDLDDIAESFIGSFAAGVVLVLLAWALARRRHARHGERDQQRSR